MNAFTDGADAMFGDAQRKKVAHYRAGGVGPAFDVLVLFSRPMRDMLFGETDLVSRDFVARVRLSDVAIPARGDTIEIDGALYKVEKAQPDAFDVWSVLTLARAEGPVS